MNRTKCDLCNHRIYKVDGRGKARKCKGLFCEQLKRYAENKGLLVTDDFTTCDKCAGKIKYWAKTHRNETNRLHEERSDRRNNDEEEILSHHHDDAVVNQQDDPVENQGNPNPCEVQQNPEEGNHTLNHAAVQVQQQSPEATDVDKKTLMLKLKSKLDLIWEKLGLLQCDSSGIDTEEGATFIDIYNGVMETTTFIYNQLSLSQSQSVNDIQAETVTSQSSHAESMKSKMSKIVVPVLDLKWRSVSNSEKMCFVCHGTSNRAVVPSSARMNLLVSERIYVPLKSRCCLKHICDGKFDSSAVEEIKSRRVLDRRSVKLSASEITDIVTRLLDWTVCKPGILNFEKSTPAPMYKLFLGVTSHAFDRILSYIEPYLRNTKLRSGRNALAMFLLKLRLNLPQQVIGHLFGIESQPVVSYNFHRVIELLEEHFLPNYIGFNHISREDAMKHEVGLARELFEVGATNLTIVMDGTYIDHEKPNNHYMQKLTYCLHKKKSLVKVMKAVLEDGYILSADVLWGSGTGNSDSHILKAMLRIRPEFKNFLRSGDNLVLDRGFGAAKVMLTTGGLKVQMPSFRNRGEKQLTTEEANYTRAVTKVRWIVEAANGWIKNVFPIFGQKLQWPYVENLEVLHNIACAIKNLMSPPLLSKVSLKDQIIIAYQERLCKNNSLMEWITENKLDRKRVCWLPSDTREIQNFPKLSMEDLEFCTFGSYQIGRAEYYAKELFEFHLFKDDTNIIRVKVKSRMCQGQFHTVWIKYDPNLLGYKAIVGHFCTCLVGTRTFGICSHITVALWFLGFKRHQTNINPKSSSIGGGILDAAAILSKALAYNSDSEAETVVDFGEEEYPLDLSASAAITECPGTTLKFPIYCQKSSGVKRRRILKPRNANSTIFQIASSTLDSRNGIPNAGNSCFINAVLQMLFLDSELENTMNLFSPLQEYHHMIFVEKSNPERATEAKNNLLRHLPTFSNGQQHDAHEFIMHLLNLSDPLIQELRTLFEIDTISDLTCTCGYQHLAIENDLGIMAENGSTVLDSMAISIPCKCGVDMVGRKLVIDLNKYLLVSFKIFGHSNSNLFKLPKSNNLSLEITIPFDDKQISYKLVSFIAHRGPYLQTGHYVAYLCVENGFMLFDDLNVKRVDTILPNDDVYVCLYKQTADNIAQNEFLV